MSKVTVVCGPPGSGKSTYVDKRKEYGDLILDIDALFVALSGRPYRDKPEDLLHFVMAAREAILGQLNWPHRLRHAWVITCTTPTDAGRMVRGAEVVTLAVPATECIRRIRNDTTRSGEMGMWVAAVTDWWAEYDGLAEEVSAG